MIPLQINDTIKRIGRVIIVVILIWLMFIFLGDWVKPKLIKVLGGYTASEYTTTVDTLETRYDSIFYKYKTVKGKVDTIYEPKIVYKDRIKVVTKDAVTGDVSVIDSTFERVYSYQNPYNDTLINGIITTKVSLNDCKIVFQGLEYTPKFPIIVKEYITIEKKVTETLFDKPKAKIGIGALSTFKGNVTAVGVYQTPSDWQYIGGYTKDVTNSIDRGAVTIGIIKLF